MLSERITIIKKYMIRGLISIIIPVYNSEMYLERCLNSIINQTYQNIEIICIDCGSIDGSLELLTKYNEADERVRLIREKYCSISRARNIGIDNVSGEYFGFVDSDDYIESDMYDVLIKSMRDSEIDISSCSFMFDLAGKTEYVKNKLKAPTEKVPAIKFLKYIYMRDYYKAVSGYLWTRLFRSSVFLKEPKCIFNEDIFSCEEVLFIANCMMKANKVIYIEKELYHYVQHDTSSSHNHLLSAEKMSALESYGLTIDLLETHNVPWWTVIWVKRFYTYRAIIIARHAKAIDFHLNDEKLKKELLRYLPTYCFLNINHPKRIYGVFKILCELQ